VIDGAVVFTTTVKLAAFLETAEKPSLVDSELVEVVCNDAHSSCKSLEIPKERQPLVHELEKVAFEPFITIAVSISDDEVAGVTAPVVILVAVTVLVL